MEPTAKKYVRTFPDLDSPDCYVDRSCDVLITVNDIRRENLLLSVGMILYKDIRWVPLPDEEDSWAMMSRSWIDQVWEGDNGKTSVEQSYSLDVWIPRKKNRAWRYQLLWSESDVGVSNEDAITGTVKGSTDSAMKTQDEAIEDLYH